MAEKAFKVPALGLVGTEAELSVDLSTTELLWNALPLASKFYVDSAVDNVTVNAAALAGNSLVYNASTDALDVDKASIASSIGGTALVYNSNTQQLDVNVGISLILVDDSLNVNSSAVGSALQGSGLTFNATTGQLGVNSFVVGTDLQGSGLTFNAATGQLGVNSFVVGTDLQGSGLTFNATTGQLGVDTTTIATKEYVDGVATGLDIKASVKYASTTNVNIGSLYAGSTFDGQTLAAGDRILVKDQANAYENGIYSVSAAAVARANDADSWTELNKGSFAFVEAGTNAGHGFVVTVANTGSTFGEQGADIEFTQFSGAGAFTAGNGLTLTGTEFSVNANALVHLNGGLESPSGSDLAINYTDPFTIDPDTGKFGLKTTTALYLDAEYGSLTVNGMYVTEIVASGLTSTDYGASSFYIANDTTKALWKVHHASTTDSDTWVTVGALDFSGTSDPQSFEASVTMRIPGEGIRTSKISGTFDVAAGANYTEYAIVGSLPGADVQVTNSGNIQVKATIMAAGLGLDAVISVTTLGYWT